MAISQLSEVIRHALRAVLPHDGAGLTDGELLGRFIEHRDEAAFAALVKRHGPLVWGVCRRLLSHHDAEDAFQAAFLVLFRKAASIRPRGMLANWLYGVAHRTALQARRTAARRKARERQVTPMPDPGAVQQDLWHDLQPLLDQELSRLPDKYRVVIVLCDLEGKARREVARHLGLPEGTLAGRLARARTILAKRMARHGLAVSGGALAAVLSQNMASAGVPTTVVSSTIKAASMLAAGQAAATGAISAKAAALTEGVLKTMLLTKLKVATAVLLAAAIAGVGAAGLLRQTQASEPAKAQGRSDTNEKQAARTPKEDMDQLQGTWRLASAENDGLRIGEGRPEIKDDRLVIAKSSLTFSFVARSPLTEPEAKKAVAEFSLDTKQTPKVMVLRWKKHFNGKEGLTQKAIYAVEGDTLKLCLFLHPGDEKNPPTDFSANAGSNRTLWVFKRDPAADKKDEKPMQGKEDFTAWGEEVGGLQAGLGIRPGERRAYHHGETVTLVVRVRNVGKEAVKFEYIRQFLDENPPTVTDAVGKSVPQHRTSVLGFHPPVEVSLGPGQEIELESRLAGGARLAGAPGLRYELRPASGGGKPKTEELPLFVGTGKVGVQYERVLGASSAGSVKLDPTLSKLATGKLELEIKEAAKE